jgi:hypothetical protein
MIFGFFKKSKKTALPQMGEYFLYILVKQDGTVVAHFNPQHGFGGMKLGEFIGTDAGAKVLKLLQSDYCCENAKWITVSDEGFVSDEQYCSNDADWFHLAEQTQPIGKLECFRRKAIEQKLTTPQSIVFWDSICEIVQQACSNIT